MNQKVYANLISGNSEIAPLISEYYISSNTTPFPGPVKTLIDPSTKPKRAFANDST